MHIQRLLWLRTARKAALFGSILSSVSGPVVFSSPTDQTIPETDSTCVLEGMILDSSGASIPEAVVILDPGHEQATSGTDGRYCFPAVDPLSQRLTVVAAGFEEEGLSIDLSGPRPTRVNLVLTPAVAAETVFVTAATRTLKKLEEVPVRTEVIASEMIRLSGSSTLADAVEFSSGLRVENNCQNCNFSQIRMLGLQGPYTQILFDGQPSMSSLAQVYGIEQIPARMVERIEVVKGGGSSIYGPGSVGGVVNVISHVPSRTGGFLLGRMGWMSGLPDQSVSASADWASTDRSSSVTLFGQIDRLSAVDLDGDGYTEIARRRFGAVGGRYRQELLTHKAEVVVDFNHVEEDRRGGDQLDLPPDRANLAEAIDSRRSAAGFTWHHTPNSGFNYRLSLSLARTQRDTYYGSGMDPNAYGESRNPLWVLDSQFNHFLSGHVLSWGGQVTTDQILDRQPAYNREYDENYRNVGVFLQDDWFLFPGFELVYGARLDKHSEIDRAIVSPRVALMWTARPNLNLRTAVATGFLPPQVFDEDLHISQAGGGVQIYRNAEALREERSTTVTAGLEWKPDVGQGVGLFEFNLFRTHLKDLFNVQENDDPLTEEVEFTRVNFGRANVYGAEVNLGYALSNALEVQFGYVEQRSRFDEAEPDFESLDFFRTPNRYGLATLIHRNPRLVDLFLGVKVTGRMKVPHYAGYIPEDRLEISPSHWVIDASVSRSFPFGSDGKVVLSLGGKNLTDYYQDDFDRGPLRDAGYVWGPRFPRMLYLSTSVEF